MCAIGMEDAGGQRFAVARLLEDPPDYQAIKVQWFDSDREFGEYKPSWTAPQEPWTAILECSMLVTKPFQLESSGRIPPATASELRKWLPELEAIQTAEPEPEYSDMDERA